MSEGPVFTSRLAGRQLLDREGTPVGRVRDVVILPTAGGEPPWVLGLVVTLNRRQIFVNLGRVAEISLEGVYLRGGTVDLRRFSRRTGELLASEPVRPRRGRRRGGRRRHRPLGLPARRLGGLGAGHRPQPGAAPADHPVEPWLKHPELFKAGELADQLVTLREMHPTDLANAVATMTAPRRAPAGRRAGGRGTGRPAGGDARGGAGPVPGRAGRRSAAPTSSRRWNPTTPLTCWPRCRPSSASGCWRRWRRSRRPTCAGCCVMTRPRPAA